MAAKNKRPTRATGLDRTGSDVRDVSGLQLRASHHRDELLDEARTLRAAGKIRESRAVEKRAGLVEQLLGAIESELRRPDSHESQ
jgi:hypothetical protein